MSEPPKKSRRWLIPLLTLSLALNLLIVGIVVGWMIAHGGKRPDRTSRDVSALVGPQIFRALAPEDRRALLGDIAGRRDLLRETRGDLRNRVEALLDALRATPVDENRIRTLLAEQRQAVAGRHAIGEDLLLTRIMAMSASERAAFAERLEKAIGRLDRS